MGFKKSTVEDLTALMLDDIERSGIPKKLAQKLGIEPLGIEETYQFLKPNKRVPAEFSACTYKIPFFGPTGEPLANGFARLRLLKGKWANTIPSFGKGKTKKAVSFKYNQKSASLPHLYFPNVIEWPMTDGKIRIEHLVITEGEKKAIKAALCGIHCVALGGVSSYQSGKQLVELLEEFNYFDFSSTDIEICYDSDLYYNEQVRDAMSKLAQKLSRLNPRSIKYAMLTAESASPDKTGLDDYLASFKNSTLAREAFMRLPRKLEPGIEAVSSLDAELRYVVDAQQFYSMQTRQLYTRHQLFDYLDNLQEVPDPKDPKKTVSQISLWLKQRSKQRTQVDSLRYTPGAALEYSDRSGKYANVWRPSTGKPKKGKADLWIEFVRDHVISTLKEDEKDLFMQWLAYPIQNPGQKINFATFIYSYRGGVGKNLVVEPLEYVYGENYKRLDGSALQADFNGWAANAQFIFIDEVWVSSYRAERNAAMNMLKSLVTNREIDLNEKFQKRTRRSNHSNYYLTSNHSDALMLEPGDRKFFVIHATEEKLDSGMGSELGNWYKEDGARFIYHYLLNKVDCSNFNPYEDAPHTRAREEAIAHCTDNVSHVLTTIKESFSTVFSRDGVESDKTLFTVEEIAAAIGTYLERLGGRASGLGLSSLGNQLVKREFVQRRISFRMKDSKRIGKIRLYALADKLKWSNAPSSAWLKHYSERTPEARKMLPKNAEVESNNVVELKSRKAV